MPTATYDLISTTTLSSATSTVTLSSIPSTYRDLAFVIEGSIASAGPYYAYITTNLNTGSYTYVYMTGTSSGIGGGAAGDNKIQFPSDGSYWSTSYKTIAVGHVLDYCTTDYSRHKPFIIQTGTGSNVIANYLLGTEPSTGAISSINFIMNVGQWAIGSIFTLYGIAA